MNRLQLVQALWIEAGISGEPPTSTLNQTGEALSAVYWIDREWRKIQTRHPNWRWMRRPFTFNTVPGTDRYAYTDCTDVDDAATISRFWRWHMRMYKAYLQSAGVGTEGWISYYDWDQFREIYKVGSVQSGSVCAITIDPSNRLVVAQNPTDVWVVSGDYQMGPQALTADTTTPDMPEPFHDLIWLGALRRYAAFESAQAKWAEAKDQYNEMSRALDADQLPQIELPPPLA